MDIKNLWRTRLFEALNALAREKKIDTLIKEQEVVVETPPKPEMGDLACPLFPYARYFRMNPALLAVELKKTLTEKYPDPRIDTAGPYVNLFLDRSPLIQKTLEQIRRNPSGYGQGEGLKGRKIMIEFSCPNTNKPLHLGHLRNDALGESVSRILAAGGADVQKVNLVNNRGIHICKSMLAYKEQGQGKTPESEGRKSDHFVGDYYVEFARQAKEDVEAEKRAQDMLVQWEKGDPELIKLWQTMNRWTLEGIEETYKRTGISFDKTYFESETYQLGRDIILKGLEKGVFYKAEDESVRMDLSEIDLDNKVVLRSDGTSVYITQDIGTAISRHKDFPFDQLVYVVASEQQYHFKVLFHILEKLGYPWATQLFHLSYGMVNLPEGKMKSREGTVVDADDLLTRLKEMALQEITEKERADKLDDPAVTAEKIALGALHYYLLQVSPVKDMVFNPAESLSFNGNTGPYLQYVGARISSMERKYIDTGLEGKGSFQASWLETPEAWELIKLLQLFPEVVHSAARGMNPSEVTAYLYELAKKFSRFYHENSVVDQEDPDKSCSRMQLVRAVKQVMKNGFYLINIPFLEAM